MEVRRQWAFTLAAVFLLLVLTALDNALLTLVASALVLALGLVLLPRQRARGALATLVAACVAFGIVALIR